jgi:hypothetical protein
MLILQISILSILLILSKKLDRINRIKQDKPYRINLPCPNGCIIFFGWKNEIFLKYRMDFLAVLSYTYQKKYSIEFLFFMFSFLLLRINR